MTKTMRTMMATLLLVIAACGSNDDAKTEGGKRRLDPEQECAAAFERDQHGGDRAAFVAACKQDLSLVACAGPAASSGFCQRAAAEPSKKAIIDAMAAALGTR